jgi:hypothetical protein
MLRAVGGNECGLDFEQNHGCVMEAEGRHVDYYSCPRTMELRDLLQAARHIIRFETTNGQSHFLSEWESGYRP